MCWKPIESLQNSWVGTYNLGKEGIQLQPQMYRRFKVDCNNMCFTGVGTASPTERRMWVTTPPCLGGVISKYNCVHGSKPVSGNKVYQGQVFTSSSNPLSSIFGLWFTVQAGKEIKYLRAGRFCWQKLKFFFHKK